MEQLESKEDFSIENTTTTTTIDSPTNNGSQASDGIKSGAQKIHRGGVVLVPQPSDDPRDPLNWPMRRKVVTFAIICGAAFSGLASSTANLSSLVIQAKVYHHTPIELSYSISSVIAGLIAGPFLFVPLAQLIGVSSCIFWSLLGAMSSGIWSALMTSPNNYTAFVISRLLGGLFGGVPQILGNGVIVNIFYLHQRGKAFAIYSTLIIMGATVGPTFGGFIISHVQWPVEFWWTVALQATLILLAFCFLEETGFARPNDQQQSQQQQQQQPRPPIPEPFLQNRLATLLPGHRITPPTSPKTLLRFALAPILIGLSPATILAGLFQLIMFGWFLTISSQISIFLQEPPTRGGYGFTPQQNAAFLFSTWVGILLAQVYGILLNDRLPMWLCRRKRNSGGGGCGGGGGFWKPEYRLHTLWVPGLVVMPVGLGIFGAALEYHLHYMVLALGAFLVCFAATVSVPVPINYLVESFQAHPQEVGTVMNAYRLTLALVTPFFIEPWMQRVGVGWVFGMAAFFTIAAFGGIGLLMAMGPRIRGWGFRGVAGTEEGAKVVGEVEEEGA